MSDLLKDEDIWGSRPVGGAETLSDEDIWGAPASTAVSTGIESPVDEGAIKAPGLSDYANEAGRAAAELAAKTTGSFMQSVALATTADPRTVNEIEAGIANIRSMSYEQAEAFRQKIKDSVRAMNVNPLAAVNYEAALRASWRGDAETAKGYLEQARQYANTGRVKDQPIYQAGEQFAESVAKDLPKQDPRFQGSLWSDVWGGVGSVGVFGLAGASSGMIGASTLGALASGAEGYEAALRDIEGANRDENGNPVNYRDDRGGLYNAGYGAEAENVARRAGQVSMAPGLSESLPIELLLDQTVGRLPFFKTPAGATAWQKAKKSLYRIGAQAFAEGGQEGFQTWANNVINQLMVDPSQDDWEGVARGALVGSIIGGGLQTGVEGYNAVAGRQEVPPPAATSPGQNAAPQRAPAAPAGARVEPNLFSDADVFGESPRSAPNFSGAPAVGQAPWAPGAGPLRTNTAASGQTPASEPVAETVAQIDAATPQETSFPEGTAIWENGGSGQPVIVVASPPQAGPDGNLYQEVIQPDGNLGYVPFDELKPASSDAQPVAQPVSPGEVGAVDGEGTRVKPIRIVESEADIEPARVRVNVSPTEAQAAAGNYQKGHIKLHGFDIALENPKGSVRRGKDPDGVEWESPPMPGDYGYIKGATAKDGDKLDVMIGPDMAAQTVFVIDQNDLKTGRYDEAKVIMGVADAEQAVALYSGGFSDGRAEDRIGAVTQLTIDEFRSWVKSGNTRRPVGREWRPTAPQALGTAPKAPRIRPATEAGIEQVGQDAGATPEIAGKEDQRPGEEEAVDPGREQAPRTGEVGGEDENRLREPRRPERSTASPDDVEGGLTPQPRRGDTKVEQNLGDDKPTSSVEDGADNKPQLVIPGAERDQKGTLKNAAKPPRKAEAADQAEVVDQPKPQAKVPAPAKTEIDRRFDWPVSKIAEMSGPGMAPFARDLAILRAWAGSLTDAQYRVLTEKASYDFPRVMVSTMEPGRLLAAWKETLETGRTVTKAPGEYEDILRETEAELLGKKEAAKFQELAGDDLDAAFDQVMEEEFGADQAANPTDDDPMAAIFAAADDPEAKAARKAESKAKAQRLYDYVAAGNKVQIPVGRRVLAVSRADQIKVGNDGLYVQRGKNWDYIFDQAVDAALAQIPRTVSLSGNWWEPLMGGETGGGKKPRRKPKTAGEAAASAVKNTGMGISEAVKGLEALFGGKNKFSSGMTFDEDTYKQALPFFKAAAAHLNEAGKDAVETFRAIIRALKEAGQSETAIQNMRPYLRRFVEDLRAGTVRMAEEAPEAAPVAEEGGFPPLVTAFAEYLSSPDNSFESITEARKFAAERGFKAAPGTQEAKQLDEMLELAVVLTARQIVQASKKRPPKTAYRRLVDLYQRQPNLGVRTSQSMANQAYSTPAPLAFIASRLAGVANAKSVLEPTAGNGMLLIEASPAKATVNELDDLRADALKAQGFRVTRRDAATESLRHAGYPVDSIIENPPFGAVPQADGRSKVFDVDGWKTTQIDHAIALQTLKNLADGGRAVLIVGSVKEGTDKSRSDSYNTKQKREFYWRLYQAYNVTDHFTVAGDLYKRQGAGWPVDVIVIEGKGKSARPLPAVELPKFYDTWESLEEKLDEAPAQVPTGPGSQIDGTAVSGPADLGNVAEDGQGLAAGSTGDQPASGGRGPAAVQSAGGEQGTVSSGGNRRELVDTGEQQPPESDGSPVATGERADGAGDRQPPAPERERLKQDAEAAQQPYQPMSGQKALETNIPTNMADAVQSSLEDLASRYGDIDAWLEKELGYKKGEIGKYLAAEQVDAVALAIDNVKKNAAFIIGDQTGIGKGRVVASALRYAMRNDLVPIFVTEKPNLYGDIIRDLNDIGVPEMLGRDLKPFLTNAGESIPLDDEAVAWYDEAQRAKVEGQPAPAKRGKFLRASGGDLHKRQMAALQKDGTGKDFDIIFTTYDQLNTVRGQTTDRRRLVAGLADRAFMVLDESHNAGGTEDAGWQKENAPESRSDFLKKVTGLAKAVMFSSATYAKRPGVMALYARTDMGKAVARPELLGDLISRGGVPMQQVVAAMLAKAGQYIRRERSFDGVSYDVQPVKVDLNAYRAVSRSLAAIAKFDMGIKKSDVWKDVIEKLKEDASALATDSGTGDISVNSTNFTSLMHNIVNQMLLAIKADSVADLAIEALKNNEKPVITVANTMGAFLKDYVENNDVERGDSVDLSFRDVLARYLVRTRRLTIKDADNNKSHMEIPLSALPGYMQKTYAEVEEMIARIDTSNLPISPIDWVRHRLTQAGYRVAEITGRKAILDYSGPDRAVYNERLDSEVSAAGRRVNIDKYNRGDLDVMILNRAGSTGLSLHASSKFKDQRRRRMIIAQAELNIDVHMQMLGRVHRTGQVIPPAFVQAYAEVPAEARPAAVLAKKMASLNASTTAARKSAFSADDSVDFLNDYGDQVAREFLLENPEFAELLNVKMGQEDETMRELTGRLALLDVEEQQFVLDEVGARYKALIANLDAMGENALEAKTLQLGAKTIGRQELKAPEGDSPFTQAVLLEEVEVNAQGKALPMPEILAKAAEALGIGKIDTENPASVLNELERTAQRLRPTFAKKWLEDFDRMVADEIKNTKADDVRAKRRETHAENRQRFEQALDYVMPGRRVLVRSKDGTPLVGIVMSVSRRGKTGATGNPLAMGAWSAEIAIPDNAQRIILPFSSMALPGEFVPEGGKKIHIEAPYMGMPFDTTVEAFANARKTGKETRFIVTGNILAGYDQTKGQGQIVNYTDDQGNVKPGILMAKGFNQKAFLNERAVRFKTAAQVMTFIKKLPAAEIVSHDQIITVRQADSYTEIEMPAARASGGTYFLNPDVRKAAYDQFAKVGSRMRYRTNLPESATRVLDAMMKVGAVFQTTDHQEIAEEIINGGKPRSGPQVLGSLGRQDTFAAEVMAELAQVVDLFQNPTSRAVTLEGVLRDVMPDVMPKGNVPLSESEKDYGAVSKRRFVNSQGQEFFVLEDREKQVWLDISGYKPARGGSRVYTALGNYAYNSDKVFIGDPAGLSDEALIRRTEVMLSSALRFGTTRHLEPHPRQIEGDDVIGVQPLVWTTGDDVGNIQSLIDASIANTLAALPELKDVRFDFAAKTFRDAEGKPMGAESLRKWGAQSGRSRETGRGDATIRRAVLLNSLARAESGKRPGILEQTLRFSRSLVEQSGLDGVLYNSADAMFRRSGRPAGVPPFVVSRKQVQEANVKAQALARKILGHSVRLEVMEKMPGFVPPDFIAAFNPSQRAIYLTMKAAHDMAFNIGHEGLHYLRSVGAITEQEFRVLVKAAKARGYGLRPEDVAQYRSVYVDRYGMTEKQFADLINEEAVADLLGEYVDGVETGDIRVDGILARIKEFIEAVLNLMQGMGLNSPNRIMRDIASGGRAALADAAVAEVDGAPLGSKGKDVTKTAAFKRWFGESKVVDDGGDPLVVYHGTPHGDFSSFDTYASNYGLMGQGSYFTENPAIASEYADKGANRMRRQGIEPEPTVYATYLSIRNPIDMDAAPDIDAWAAAFSDFVTPESFAYAKTNEDAYRVVEEALKDEMLPMYEGAEIMQYGIRQMGHDGITHVGGGRLDGNGERHRVWIVFEPTQVKSAIGNSGAFDAANPNIIGSRGRRMPQVRNNAVASTFQAMEDDPVTWWNDRNKSLLERVGGASAAVSRVPRRMFQNTMVDWQRQQAAIEEQSGPISDRANVYVAETLFPGRTGERLEDLRMDEIEPIIDAMVEGGVSQKELDEYLYALHAPERNAYIATIDPNLQDGGSGMTDAEAAEIVRAARASGKKPALDRLVKMVRALQQSTREKLLAGGVIDGTVYESWTSTYQNYVPLRGFEANPEEDSRLPSGQKYDTRAKVDVRAMGRRSRADSPLAYLIAQAQQAIVLSEKARVGQAILELASTHPNPELWEVNQVVMKKTISKTTGFVTYIPDNLSRTLAENVIAVRRGGKIYWVTLHHEGLAAGVRNMDGGTVNFVMRAMLRTMRILAALRTAWNPEFFVPNFLRDLATAGIHIAGDQGTALMARTIKDVPKALVGAWRGEQGNLTGDWAKYYREFAQAGGKVGYGGMQSIEAIKEEMATSLWLANGGVKMTPIKALRRTFEFIENVNNAVESAIRLALYVNMRKAGYSRDQSAYAAKEVTVNFNRKGEHTNYLAAAYLFFNPSVQGTARVFKAIATSRKVQVAIMGMVVAGLVQDLVNSLISGDGDDDGEDDYDQIPKHIRERNLVFMVPGSEDGQKVLVPLPWVYNVFFYAGQNIGRVMRGKADPLEASVDTFAAFMQAANPISSETWTQMITPTLLDPIYDIASNQDWKGDRIMPEQDQSGTPLPDSQRYFSNVNPGIRAITDALNSLTGGDAVRPGYIDISPGSVEYVVEFMFGGVGNLVNRVTTIGGDILNGDPVPPEKIPLLRKVYTKQESFVGQQEYYDMRAAVMLTDAQLKHYRDAGDFEMVRKIRKDYAADIRAKRLFDETDKVLRRLRKRRDNAKTPEERRQIEELRVEMMAKTRRLYRQMQQQGAAK